ncbi:MAG: hypothetical protein SFU91_11530 [Chloroherpetonaceae bacterium]|nr:hypothetical protein [Chloroherpetonaceae bacterium]
MKADILNKRKQWLPESENDGLDKWTKEADKSTDFSIYFGIKLTGIRYEKDEQNNNAYFKKSLSLFKTVLSRQKANNASGLPVLSLANSFDALITIVGFSPEPLLHTILALSPNSVYPIVTKESAAHYKVMNIQPNTPLQCFEKIFELYKDPSQNITVKPISRAVESIGSIDTFKRVREIIAEIRKEKSDARIALDITGGKKSADASAFLTVAIEKDIDIFYVDFEEYADGKPKCGTEFLNKLENPYDLYNIDLITQAKELFKNGNYAAAQQLFEKAKNNLESKAKQFGLTSELEAIEKMYSISKCLQLWDALNFDNIKEHTEFLSGDLISLLKSILNDDPYYFALNLIIDARRYIEQARYNDATIRLTQSMEHLLTTVIENNNDPSFCDYINAKKEIYQPDLINKLHNLRIRRNSMVHKTNPIGKKAADEFYKTCISVLKFEFPRNKIDDDLIKFSFPKEFNIDGTLK